MTRITIVTDAWHPQVNGVVRSIENTNAELERMGVDVCMVTPQNFHSVPCPTYPEIRLSLAGPGAIARHVAKAKPDFIHIATEGPIGLMMRRYCRKTKWPFTTSYHTRFPEYVSARLPVPESWCYALQRKFHNGAAGTFVGHDALSLPLTFEDVRAAGATLGSGVVMVFDETADLPDTLLRIASFMRDESCGQCVPCRVGTVRQVELLRRLRGPASAGPDDLQLLTELGQAMRDASICGLGQTASSAVESAVARLRLFERGGLS